MSDGDPEAEGSEPVLAGEGEFDIFPAMDWKTLILDPCVPGDRVRFKILGHDQSNAKAGGLNELEIYGRRAN